MTRWRRRCARRSTARLAKLVEKTLAVTPDVVAMVKKARGDM
jgi:hypothetical protein